MPVLTPRGSADRQALVALNVAPMTAASPGSRLPVMPQPLKIVNSEQVRDVCLHAALRRMPGCCAHAGVQVVTQALAAEIECDAMLAELPAQHLRGTFSDAYEVLSAIQKAIGWDALLKVRAEVRRAGGCDAREVVGGPDVSALDRRCS